MRSQKPEDGQQVALSRSSQGRQSNPMCLYHVVSLNKYNRMTSQVGAYRIAAIVMQSS